MSLRIGLLLVGLTNLGSPQAEGSAPVDPLADMVRTEYDFAAAAAAHGQRAAFLEYLAPDAITFAPAPVDGRDVTASSQDGPGQLQWYPEFATIASSGDLGLSTGPWTIKADGQPDAYGHFVTLWRKQANGTWRAVFDSGIAHPAQAPPPARLQPAGLSSQLKRDSPVGADASTLRAADREYSRLAASLGYSMALRRLAHPDLRVHRNGSVPLLGVSLAAAVLRGTASLGEWNADLVSTSGDLGYTYGRAVGRSHDGKPRDTDAFLRVWRHVDGRWQLLLDQVTEIPE